MIPIDFVRAHEIEATPHGDNTISNSVPKRLAGRVGLGTMAARAMIERMDRGHLTRAAQIGSNCEIRATADGILFIATVGRRIEQGEPVAFGWSRSVASCKFPAQDPATDGRPE